MSALKTLLAEVRACQICKDALAHPPRPVLQCSSTASILIAGQAPGRKVHASGVPFDDASGDRLRDWLGVERELFYTAVIIAILPMGFCYPGSGSSGDLPPRPECAPAWRARLLAQMPQIKLTLVLGQYAQTYHFTTGAKTLTERVRAWRNAWPAMLPLPHPSPRNIRWFKQNPWFEFEVLPELRARVQQIIVDHN